MITHGSQSSTDKNNEKKGPYIGEEPVTSKAPESAGNPAADGVASAAAAVIAALLLVLRPGPAEPPAGPPAIAAPTSLSMTPVAPSSLEATVLVTSRGWGTRIEMTCTYRPESPTADDAGDELAMFAVGRDGTRTQLASWVARDGATAAPSGSTSMPVDQIAAVQIVAVDTGDVLLQRSL